MVTTKKTSKRAVAARSKTKTGKTFRRSASSKLRYTWEQFMEAALVGASLSAYTDVGAAMERADGIGDAERDKVILAGYVRDAAICADMALVEWERRWRL